MSRKFKDFKKSIIPPNYLNKKLYFNEISKYKPLSIDEELKLWKQYKYNNGF